jgi:putative hemolysin
MAASKYIGASTALKIIEKIEQLLSISQIGMTISSILIGVYGGERIAKYIMPLFELLGLSEVRSFEISMGLSVIAITYVSIVLGELVPMTMALTHPEKIASAIAPFIKYLFVIFYPFVKLLSVSTKAITGLLGIKQPVDIVSEAELRYLLKTASREGVIEDKQTEIHKNVFNFADKRARHIMTHRTEVEWIDLTLPKVKLHKAILSAKFGKVVVCKKSLDNFVGILNIRNYLTEAAKGKPKIENMLYQPVVIPENTRAQKVLDHFRKTHTFFAVVLNEYGSFEGIITLHNIVENLIGEIYETGSESEPDIIFREDNSALINAEANVEILSQIIEDFTVDFEEIDYSTVAGFVLANINKIPISGDKFEYNGYFIEIVDLDGNKIDKILVYK